MCVKKISGRMRINTVSFFFSDHPKNLTFSTDKEQLMLYWTIPVFNEICIHRYKVSYTIDEWKDQDDIFVDTTENSCEIPNILPLKTYRITITSVLQNSVDRDCNEEIIFNSPSKC